MTESVKNKAEELKYAILNSEEYKNFDNYRIKLLENPELKARVDQFRAANVVMQMQKAGAGNVDMQKFAAENEELLDNSLVRDFLNAELVLCKMLQKINKILVSDVELELDFL